MEASKRLVRLPSSNPAAEPNASTGIPTESPLVLRESLQWVPPTTALLQRRTTKRLNFRAIRP